MKTKFSLLICILSIFILVGCTNSNVKLNSKKNNKIVNEDGITSLKIYNMRCEGKDIKIKSDINKIIGLINSEKITKSNAGEKDGISWAIEINYSDNKKERLSFSSNFMVHNDKSYEVDKNIDDKIEDIYGKK